MTREEYGAAYQKGFNLTVRFLVSRGLAYDSAQETAQMLAERAKHRFAVGSPAWVRADDIVSVKIPDKTHR